ncbi:hypothetical protein CDL12_06475 [Handroanthus impetiginosus]|uniref:C2H2-type domain-containing protein n=1 Tax=Handroanthus impetiginosus TaxID=429701 RepID=A0A2G9HTJ1_9LAMI|nr:hypothetical protein CDL12_06475 [Handroanthus impetiginosus]
MNKRSRDEQAAEDMAAMAKSLLLFSTTAAAGYSSSGRVFTCKTCNKQFPSFQALGGHRASHKKQRLAMAEGGDPTQPPSPAKRKTHECSICGMEFPIGQALGGHMRRHREAINVDSPIVKKVNSSRRVLVLDLNLTPLENKFVFQKLLPAVDCFF